MSAATLSIPMAKKAESAAKGRVEFKAPASWIRRAESAAESLGLSLSAYIRLLVTQDMERLEQSRAGRPNGKG